MNVGICIYIQIFVSNSVVGWFDIHDLVVGPSASSQSNDIIYYMIEKYDGIKWFVNCKSKHPASAEWSVRNII